MELIVKVCFQQTSGAWENLSLNTVAEDAPVSMITFKLMVVASGKTELIMNLFCLR